MERRRFTVIRGGRDPRPPAAERAIDLICVPQDRWGRTIELRHGDDTVGVLRREGIARFRATAEAAGTTWVFDCIGLALLGVTIHCDGVEIGRYVDGEVSLPGGSYRRTRGRWVDGSSRVLLRDRSDSVRIEIAGQALPERFLLALLGEYLKQVDLEPPEES